MTIAISTKKLKKEIADGIEDMLEVIKENPMIQKIRLKNLMRKVGK
jgi:hypothetical protein